MDNEARDLSSKPLEALIQRASSLGDPLALASNLLCQGIYVLHGKDDEVVPVQQARRMVQHLTELGHGDIRLHEEPNKGHWYSSEVDDGGAHCMDWPPLMVQCPALRVVIAIRLP